MKFKHDTMFSVNVSINGRQKYTINTTANEQVELL